MAFLFAVMGLAAGLAGAASAASAAGAAGTRSAQSAQPTSGNVDIIGTWPSNSDNGEFPQTLYWKTETATGVVSGYETEPNSATPLAKINGVVSGHNLEFEITGPGSYTAHVTGVLSGSPPIVFTGRFGGGPFVGRESTPPKTFAPVEAATTSAPAVIASPPAAVPSSPAAVIPAVITGLRDHNRARSTIASSLPTPRAAFTPVSSDVVNAAITVGAALLITFPASLFNATFQENYTEIRAATVRRMRALHLMRPAAPLGSGAADAAGILAVAVEDPSPATAAAAQRPAPRPRKRVAATVAALAVETPTQVVMEVPPAPIPTAAMAAVSVPAAEVDKGLHPTTTFVIVLLVGALLGCFNDPHFGITGHSGLTYLGVILSELVGMIIPALVAAAYHRSRHGSAPASLHALPGGLLIALGCVVVSRLVGFEPGYLYGVVIGVSFSRDLPKNEKGHVIALSTSVVIVVSLAAWFLWVPVNHAAAHDGSFIGTVLFDNLLGAMFVSGLVGSVISMVPLQFMPGSTLRAWKQTVWAAVFLVSLFLLIQVLLRPRGGHGHTSHAPLVTTLVLFGVFAVGSIAFHDYWERRGHATRGEPIPELPQRLKGLWKAPATR